MTIVAMPEAMSLIIIISLRLERSTRAPANGEAISIGATKKKPDQRQGGGRVGLFICPDGHGEAGHAGAQQGDDLTDPDDGEAKHPAWAF